jgi:hypothetical protein
VAVAAMVVLAVQVVVLIFQEVDKIQLVEQQHQDRGLLVVVVIMHQVTMVLVEVEVVLVVLALLVYLVRQ